MNNRGIVITDMLGVQETPDGIRYKFGFDSQNLRRFVLFWDQIDLPTIIPNPISAGLGSDDIKILQEEAVLVSSEVQINSPKHNRERKTNETMVGGYTISELIEIRTWVQLEVLRHRNKEESCHWSIGQSDVNLQLPIYESSENFTQVDNIEISLINSIPVPEATTKISDILEFKLKRRSELLAFRSSLDELYTAIRKAENYNKSLLGAKEKIEMALINLHKTLDETRIQSISSTLKLYCQVDESSISKIIFPAVGYMAGSTLGISDGFGALAGIGLDALIHIVSKKPEPIDKLPRDLKDFAYLYYLGKELKS